MDCIFCKIVGGDMPVHLIYENDKTLCFLDVAPLSHGHTLIIPKYHAVNLLELPEEYWTSMHDALLKTTEKLKKVFKYTDFNFMNNHGKYAGQVVFHYHFHVIPRLENDGLDPHHKRMKITLSKEILERLKHEKK